MSWLWKVLLLCIILGGAQWMHTHPDSQASQQALVLWGKMRVEWDTFVAHVGEYWKQFPTYLHQMLDTTPKPKLPIKP